MFTGIIEGIGHVVSIKRQGQTGQYEIEVGFDMGDVNVGDSVACDGCCLTVTSRLGNRFWADISDETLRVTTLGGLAVGHAVNIERALKVGARLGGHLVQGHVDGVGKIELLQDVEGGKLLKIQAPHRLSRYIVEKGSITVNGLSLTVNAIEGNGVTIRLVPHTVQMTTMNEKKVGDPVNLEVDIIGKYVEKLRFLGSEEYHDGSEISEEFLKKHGF